MYLKNYIIRFALILSIVQLSLTVYLGIQGFMGVEFYDRMFIYSIFISMIPMIFGIISFGLSSNSNTETLSDHTNGFVNRNGLTKQKNNQFNDMPIYLFIIGFCFLVFNVLFSLLKLPNWINVILPLLLSISLVFSKKESELLLQSE